MMLWMNLKSHASLFKEKFVLMWIFLKLGIIGHTGHWIPKIIGKCVKKLLTIVLQSNKNI